MATPLIVLTSHSQLESEALVAAIRAVEALAHERTVAKVRAQTEDIPPIEGEVSQLPYDPASVFLLEIMVSITSNAPQYIEELWYVSLPISIYFNRHTFCVGQPSSNTYLPCCHLRHNIAFFSLSVLLSA